MCWIIIFFFLGKKIIKEIIDNKKLKGKMMDGGCVKYKTKEYNLVFFSKTELIKL